jgi:hypothetical protein
MLLISIFLLIFTFGLAFSGYAWVVERVFNFAATGIGLAFIAFLTYCIYRVIRAFFRWLFSPVNRHPGSASPASEMQVTTMPGQPQAVPPAQPKRPRNIVRRPPPPDNGPPGT